MNDGLCLGDNGSRNVGMSMAQGSDSNTRGEVEEFLVFLIKTILRSALFFGVKCEEWNLRLSGLEDLCPL